MTSIADRVLIRLWCSLRGSTVSCCVAPARSAARSNNSWQTARSASSRTFVGDRHRARRAASHPLQITNGNSQASHARSLATTVGNTARASRKQWKPD